MNEYEFNYMELYGTMINKQIFSIHQVNQEKLYERHQFDFEVVILLVRYILQYLHLQALTTDFSIYALLII